MSWMMGLGGGGNGGKAPNPLIATSGKWLATCIALFAMVFWTPDLWSAFEETIYLAIRARYAPETTFILFWLLAIAAYPLMFFAVRMGLGLIFVGLVFGLITKLFGPRP